MKKKFAVIGYPLTHSLSPLLHNSVFKKLRKNCMYSAVEIKPGELEKKVDYLKKNYSGFNVTIPHKIAILGYMGQTDDDAKKIGAVNTVLVENGKLMGYNTDAPALREALGNPHGKKILVLGAGGAARAAAFALSKRNSIRIYNRTKERAEELAKETGGSAVERIGDAIKDCDILLNTTSVGMHPNTGESPASTKDLMNAKKNLVVCDIVYNPIKTKLLAIAEQLGYRTISGVEMFVRQAALSEKIWLGIEPDIKFMRETVVKELEKK